MDLNTIGGTIQHRRKSLRVTQYDLAEIAEVSLRSLRDIEKGIANPELKTLLSICDVLGLSIKIEVLKYKS